MTTEARPSAALLMDYDKATIIRPATRAELAASDELANCRAGVITVNGRSVYAVPVEVDDYDLRDFVESLRAEAEAAGDEKQVAICDKALDGDLDAVEECAKAICAASAAAASAAAAE